MSQYRYTSVNHPESFDFHDSVFRLGRVGDTEIAVCVQALNISKAAEQNPYECDMEIQTAHIVFRGVSEFVYDPGKGLGKGCRRKLRARGAEDTLPREGSLFKI